MMVRMGDADAMIAGMTSHYPETIRPALEVLDLAPGVSRVSGMYILIIKGKVYFFADTTVNVDPNPEELAEIAILSARAVKRFDIEPRVAMLSFSNFGSAPSISSNKVKKATEIVKRLAPDILVEGEMQADTAVVPDILNTLYPFSSLKSRANVLIFPNLDSGNIAYKLLNRIGGAEVVGPILNGFSKPVYVLQRGAEVDDVVNMAAFAMVEAKRK